MEWINKIQTGDCFSYLKNLPDASIDCCVTSPPYYCLRDYGVAGQIGLEVSPEAFIEKLVNVFREVRRVLKPDGTLWVNIGDSYAGSYCGWGDNKKNAKSQKPESYETIPNTQVGGGCKPKDLIGIPWLLAIALRNDGWYLRQDIIWHKPNPMPESVTDRCTKSHEYVFLLSNSQKYYFDSVSIMEAAAYDGRKETRMKGSHKYSKEVTGLSPQTFAARGHERWRCNDRGDFIRNKRSVWTVCTKPFKESHFASFPEKLIVDCIKAGCPEGGIVLDPFMGAGTTALVACKLNRRFAGCDLNPEYVMIAERRLKNEIGLFL